MPEATGHLSRPDRRLAGSGELADAKPLSLATEAELVQQKLRAAILRGEMLPHEPISQVQLARELGVSRTPLREALRGLEGDGLIRSSPRRRVEVAPFAMADLEDVYASRIVLEVLALRLTMTNLQEGDLDKLEQHCDSMESHEGDFDTWEAPHVAFHECLAMGAGPQMRKVLANLADHAVRYRRFSLSVPRGWARGAQEHRAILSAVRSNARQDAGTQLAQHFARTALSVIAVLDPGHDPKQVREALALVADSSEHSR